MGGKGDEVVKNFKKWVTSFMDGPQHTLKYQTLYQTDNLHLLLLWGPQLN